MQNLAICHHCHKWGDTKKILKCRGCLHARYCCKEHQVADWAKHKVICKQLKEKAKSYNTASEFELFDHRVFVLHVLTVRS